MLTGVCGFTNFSSFWWKPEVMGGLSNMGNWTNKCVVVIKRLHAYAPCNILAIWGRYAASWAQPQLKWMWLICPHFFLQLAHLFRKTLLSIHVAHKSWYSNAEQRQPQLRQKAKGEDNAPSWNRYIRPRSLAASASLDLIRSRIECRSWHSSQSFTRLTRREILKYLTTPFFFSLLQFLPD